MKKIGSKKTIVKVSAIAFFSIALLLACYLGFTNKSTLTKCKYWNSSYHELVNVSTRSPEKYGILGYSSYSSDKSNVYYNCNLLLNADAETFEVIGNGHENLAKDVRYVYSGGEIIDGADPATYTYTGHWTIGKDKNNIYFDTTKLSGVDYDSFEILRSGFELAIIEDKNGTKYLDSWGKLHTQKPLTKEFDY